MNVHDFTNLLQHPNEVVSASQTQELEEVVVEYPYFQAARAIHLKGLKTLNSFKYNNALRVTAAHTTDREVLFDFITSKEFLQNTIADTLSGKMPVIRESEGRTEDVVTSEDNTNLIETSDDMPLPQTITDANTILNPKLFTSKNPDIDKAIQEEKAKAAKALDIGKPIPFTKEEKYSFSEWLKLASPKTVKRAITEERAEERESTALQLAEENNKKKKFDLIDQFITNNPKIAPARKKNIPVRIEDASKFDKKELMTETLAKVYLEQKKYKNAIQAYTILSLKYPEKSGFFADRIKAVQKIQQENS